jgi:hypothetical protein
MSVVARLAAFVAVLVLCFGAAYAVGAAVGPLDDGPATSGGSSPTTAPAGADMNGDMNGDMEHGG